MKVMLRKRRPTASGLRCRRSVCNWMLKRRLDMME